ncbi:MAG: S8/S53 family peptidase [Rhizobiaceae bacterium]
MDPWQTLVELARPSGGHFVRASRASRRLRFILELPDAASAPEMQERLEGLLGSAVSRLKPLFPRETGVLARYFLLALPASDDSVEPAVLHDCARALGERLDLLACEPEIAGEVVAPQLRQGREIEIRSAWCLSHEDQPANFNWALKNTKIIEAWSLVPGKGAGVLVAQPDTGIASHPVLNGASLRLDLATDILDHDADPSDPLDPKTANPGHGTGTASVVIARKGKAMWGASPGASLVPVRCIRDVKVFNPTPIAQAVQHARNAGCHIVTMSLGGFTSSALRRSTRAAVDANMIVLAAAGNCIGSVVYPARHRHVIAVAGTNEDDRPWKGTCRGHSVDVSAPAEFVWRAGFDFGTGGGARTEPGQGTSFAVALVAGAAALWLAHHGRDRLVAEAVRRGIRLQQLFLAAVRRTARVPAGWDSTALGAGILNAEALVALAPANIPDIEPIAASDRATMEELARLVTEVTGVEAGPYTPDWLPFESEIANMALSVSMLRAGQANGERMDQPMAGASRGSQGLRRAVAAKHDKALEHLLEMARELPG